MMRFRFRSGADLAADPVLARFRRAIDAAYGERVERVVLFGSRARGNHRAESDYDVAVFLKDWRSLWDELEGMSAAALEILVETGADISAKPFRAAAWKEQSAFMHELRRDGRRF